jgi:virginiamycin B lyase
MPIFVERDTGAIMRLPCVDLSCSLGLLADMLASVKHRRNHIRKSAMEIRRGLLVAAAVLPTVWLHWTLNQAMAQPAATLVGQVTSAEEGPIEGAIVSAKKDGSAITISVASDDRGNFAFPAGRLEPGKYILSIRAIGYELDGPMTVAVSTQSAPVSLALKKTGNLPGQLSNGEWLASFPGTPQQKAFMDRCSSCHTYERIAYSTHDADGWIAVLQRMAGYAPGTTPAAPQMRKEPRAETNMERLRRRAEYLASINLSGAPQLKYQLKTLPRLKGRSNKVVITEYDLPRVTAMPHDVILDEQGMVWYTDFGEQFLGRLDPKTGKVTEYAVPVLKRDYPTGMLDIQLKDDYIWLGLMLQAGVAKFDRKTEKFTLFPLPRALDNPTAQVTMVTPMASHVDGKLWMNSVGIPGVHRMDLATLAFETFEPFKDMPRGRERSVYGIKADSQNNLYFMDYSSEYIGRIDAKSGKASLYRTPTPNSNPRRGHMDAQDRLWFTEYRANKLALFDTKTETFTEWEVPTPYTFPYDVMPDKHGELWTAGMSNDRVVRLDPKSGQATEYQLPRTTNVRRVWVDDTTTSVTFWIGNNHGASIVKVEPLD